MLPTDPLPSSGNPADDVDPASPCTGVCVLDAASGACRGCGRTGPEIQAWPWAGPDERRRILARIRADASPSSRDRGR